MKFLKFSSLLGMQLKGMNCKIFQILVLGSMIFLRQCNMIEQDRIFVFVWANSLFKLNSGMWVGAGSSGVSTIDVQGKKLFRKGRK